MYFVDNGSAVPVMPQVKPVSSATPQFFTEGGNGTPPTYPGPDWFNIFQLELLNVLKEAQINPDKANHTQLVTAMKKLFLDASSNGSDIPDKAAFLSNLGLKESKQIVFTSSAQLAIPASITEIYVTGCAAGGGGAPGAGGSNAYFGGGGGGGGAGQSIIKKKFTVTPGSSLMITIGAAGVGGVGNVDRGGVATAGGDTIIGALQTLKGGSGGSNAINGTDGATGGISGSGYPSGGYGNDGHITAGCASGGSGASSPFGGGGGSGRAGTQGGMAGSTADGYGAGGGGGGGKYGNNAGVASGGSGGNGSPGFVIIEW